jgi:aerobic carbon-monoxide dehydrogenase small subunit
MMTVALIVNGRAVEATAEPRSSLADFLRDGLNLTGTHLGCEHGVCGACTVLLDGATARSCITLAAACEGARVTTIEGLDDDEIAAELRAAFTREHALQCGYCTPGMIIAARDLVERLAEPDERLIRIGLSGNLCRCAGYVGVVRAVHSVIASRRARGVSAEADGGRKILGPVGAGHAHARAAAVTKDPATLEDAPESARSIPDFTPAMGMERSFTVAYRPNQVFDFFGDITAVAACLPGASLTSAHNPDRVEGVMRVKIGPIIANFNGAARIARDPASLSGRIIGIGGDRRSRSSTQGEIRYRLAPIEGGAATRIELSIGYNLKGALAQIGRTGLIHDLVGRLVDDFARNLDQRLSGRSPVTSSVSIFNGLSLLINLLRDRAARLIRKQRTSSSQ